MLRIPKRAGFTLIELFVVIFIIAVILAIVLPAMQHTHGPARRNSCANHMKQLALALHTHHDAFRRLPAASLLTGGTPAAPQNLGRVDAGNMNPAGGFSWIVAILPFMDETPLFNAIHTSSGRMSQTIYGAQVAPLGGRDPGTVELDQLVCMSGAARTTSGYGVSEYGLSSYVALFATSKQRVGGTTPATDADGAISVSAITRHFGRNFASIKDGTSRTLMLAETKEPTSSAWIDGGCNWVVGSSWSGAPPDVDRSGFITTAYLSLNELPYRDPKLWRWGPSSEHSGGVIMHALADGSVRTIAPDVDPRIYLRMITCEGGEPVMLPD